MHSLQHRMLQTTIFLNPHFSRVFLLLLALVTKRNNCTKEHVFL